jgi:hypothetical protein
VARGTEVEEAIEDEDADDDGPTLGVQLNSSRGTSLYDGEVKIRSLAKEPVVVRIPRADGSIVEVQARVVKISVGK